MYLVDYQLFIAEKIPGLTIINKKGELIAPLASSNNYS